MPVFVEWRWREKTKSFLLIFHFYDDFSRTNLRIKKCVREGEEKAILIPEPPKFFLAEDAWMT
jgi:hypothetical protein